MRKLVPRVFISYSHDSESHRERVLSLAQRLRDDGIDAVLDQYIDGTPPKGWPRWMLDEIEAADFVLLICTETYYRRFRGHEIVSKGLGVDWEGALITQAIYEQQGSMRKFVPVLFASTHSAFIPEPLRPRTYYTITSETAPLVIFRKTLGTPHCHNWQH
jgi:hypothetical protein